MNDSLYAELVGELLVATVIEPPSSQQNDGQARPRLAQLANQLRSLHIRQLRIDDDERDRVPLEGHPGIGCGTGLHDREAPGPQQPSEKGA